MEEKDNRLWELIAGALNGELDAQGRQELENLLEAEPEQRRTLEQARHSWKAMGMASATFRPDVQAARLRFVERLKAEGNHGPQNEPLQKKEGRSISLPVRYFMRAAAAVLVLAAAAWLLLSGWDGAPAEGKWATIATGEEKAMFLLPDSSRVWLNKHSRLQYAISENGPRKLQMTGEAFFEVRKDSGRTFTVVAGETVTEVLGTSFGLSTEKDGGVKLAVRSGKVAFREEPDTDEDTGEKGDLLLTAGMAAAYHPSLDVVQALEKSDPNALAWKDEQLVFNNTHLQEVANTLSGYFGVPITVTNTRILQCRFTARFENPDLDEIMQVLTASNTLRFEVRDGNYIISGKGCQ